MLAVYAEESLGAYGWDEKPWYRPGARLASFLAELERRGLHESLDFRTAPAATDNELARFHDLTYVQRIREACATNTGSLDRAPPAVNRRTRTLLAACHPAKSSTSTDLSDVLGALNATLEAFGPFLQSEGLAAYDPDADAIRLTPYGRHFLADTALSLGGPTYARAHVERAARHVCGAVVDATTRLLEGELTRAFVPIAGFHHAHAAEARMYCLYNDPALAIQTALDRTQGVVLYVDVDIHHGDGVHRGFAEHPRVQIVDIHEVPTLPPKTQQPVHGPSTIGIGPEHDDKAYRQLWSTVAVPQQPELIIFEAGVDGLKNDPMSNQALTSATFIHVTEQLLALSRRSGAGLLALGGGGYEPEGTAAAWADIVDVLRRDQDG